MATQLQIYNLALTMIGSKTVTSTSQDIQEAIVLTDVYDHIRDMLLDDFSWKFANRTTKIFPESTIDISTITHSDTTVTVNTTSNHGYSDEFLVRIANVSPSDYNGVFPITNASGTQFNYVLSESPDSNGSGSDMTVRHTGGKFEYVYTLPSDHLKTIGLVDSDLPYDVDETYLYCDEPSYIFLRYVQSDMTVGDQSISFDWLLALRLAAEVAPKLTGDRRLKSELMQDFIFWSRHFMAKDHNKALRNKTYYDEYEESDFPWAWRR